MKYVILYITAKDRAEAGKIGRVLVEERLAACVNILDNVHSMYWWEGRVQSDTEAVIIAKTREELTEKAVARVKSVHSYSCPCVVALPILNGSKDYLDWIKKETGGL
ncbi:MAG: divalent-cation tolerance protein CutA [Candidatus Omnitrophota bacterium]